MVSIPLYRQALVGAWQQKLIMALFTLLAFPNNLSAQGLPVETGSHLPVALWFIGAGILGLVLAYGIMRNRTRTRADKQRTEQATKDLYAKENRGFSTSQYPLTRFSKRRRRRGTRLEARPKYFAPL